MIQEAVSRHAGKQDVLSCLTGIQQVVSQEVVIQEVVSRRAGKQDVVSCLAGIQ